jgi:S1-C subfamily serine protease
MMYYETAKGKMICAISIAAIAILAVAGTALLEWRKHWAIEGSRNVWLGVETVEVNRGIREQYRIESAHGLLVSRTFVGSPATVGGIKKGDVIRRWNGVSVTGQRQFQRLIDGAQVGQEVRFSIDRKGKPLLAHVQLGVRPGSF